MEPANCALSLALTVNRIQLPVQNLGPGRRIGVWLQGCGRRCHGCISPSLWSDRGGLVDTQQLAEEFAKASDFGFEGITVTGGEPFEQYGPLMVLCAYLEAITSLSIVVYTGYRLDELLARHPDRAFVRYIDYLVDGPYVRELHDNAGWRGSSNQRLYSFANDAIVEQQVGWPEQRLSVAVPDAKHVFMAGIPRRGDLARLATQLRRANVELRFE